MNTGLLVSPRCGRTWGLQAGGEGDVWATSWLSESMFLLAPHFSAPKVQWGGALVGKVTPLPLPLFILPKPSPIASPPVHWLGQCASGLPVLAQIKEFRTCS